ncbi:hypothetical protein B7R21_17420 [Subtercola boreus]|uniref:ABC transporter domain-containing protein n=1 Tax=Subtercola boreus TaxID=120213 RepID=A0A3E0VBI8_9MICO|nr:sugar ABC transporter ATP-binding protein [Subtercola boreus]RFA07005.1 hypothetical protein B7R21_17420 [Subtercola boreus]
MTATATLLSVEGVNKSFGGARALTDVSIQFLKGEVHALLGENGAGKSTLVKIIAQVISADSGRVVGSKADLSDVAMVFQELSVIPDLSVRENVALSLRKARNGVIPKKAQESRIREALTSAGLGGIDLDVPVEALPLAQRQLLEIARGLASNAETLILDEPTATLSDVEIRRVHDVVRSLAAEGRAIVYITHRLAEVFELSNRITVMRAGKVVANGPTSDFDMASLVTHMLGAEHRAGVVEIFDNTFDPGGARTLRVKALSVANKFNDVSFEVCGGEVTALFGQIGSGADEVVRAIVGYSNLDSGSVRLDEHEISGLSRHGSQKAGVSYVSADRVIEGVFLTASVVRNLTSGVLPSVSRGGVLTNAKEIALAKSVASRVTFDESRVRQPVGSLSGGNQQKIAIGRALATNPAVLVLNEPTRGVDIGARSGIYRALRKLASRNVAVVVYSSDVVELRELADNVITMFRGKTVSEHRVTSVTDAQLVSEILNGTA